MDDQQETGSARSKWRGEPFVTPRAKRWSIGSAVAATLGVLLLCGGNATGVLFLVVAFVAYRGARRIDDRQHPFPPLIRKAMAWRPKSRREWALAGGGVVAGLALMSGGGRDEAAQRDSRPTQVVVEATAEATETQPGPTRTRRPTSTPRPTQEPATATVEAPTDTPIPPSPVPPTIAPPPTVVPPPTAAPQPIIQQQAAPPEPPPAAVAPSVNCGGYRRCDTFGTWREAQDYFLACGYSRMDNDGDGIACENLPGAP